MFGAGAMTNSIPEIRGTELMFVIGSNTTEAHPVISLRMKKAVQRGAKLIVVDPRKIELQDVELDIRSLRNKVRRGLIRKRRGIEEQGRVVTP